MNWIRLIGERLGLWRCCWLEDFDGEFNLRIARRLPRGRWHAKRMSFTNSEVVLMPDGSLRGVGFVHHWHWNDEVRRERKEIETLENMVRL
jgi:hypothetical protein